MAARIHSSAAVADSAVIGDGSQIWMWCQIRDNVSIGENCIFGKGIYVDSDVSIGNNCKIQNHVSIFHGVTIDDGVFVGPHVCFTNDKLPRAVNPDGSLKSATDWVVTKTHVKKGAALGANSTIVCGITVGEWAMVAAGSVASKDVPDHALVVGNPARIIGYVCACGQRVTFSGDKAACGCGRSLKKSADGRVSMA